MLELPKKISIKDEKGKVHKDYPMWIYWMLTEGVLGVDPNMQKTDDGKMPPVIHVDSDAHLFSDVDGSLITDKMWGIYYKPDFNFKGVQGGSAPYKIMRPVDDVKVDPYGPASPEFQTTPEFAHMWCSALAHCQKRFKGKIKTYHKGPSGGLGCFTPDSFPIFDKFCENVYIIADSNHGYKMIGVGDLVSNEILGKESSLLKPFRFNRYAKGELHPVSSSPFPWS
jgi:glycine/D-amino acid oxidase-like deaminating enzyme